MPAASTSEHAPPTAGRLLYREPIATRSLNDAERRLLDFLLDDHFEGRAELLAQAATVKTAGSPLRSDPRP